MNIGQVLDIGGSQVAQNIQSTLKKVFLLQDEHRHGQSQPQMKRTLPTELFYYGDGLRLWQEVCWLPDYHQTRDEISLLEEYGAVIAQYIPAGCTIVDMGSGDIRKPSVLLMHLDRLKIPVTYYALDLSYEALSSSMAFLSHQSYTHITFYGLWGTFEDARLWLRAIPTPKCILSLGSMFGNDELPLAVARMAPWREVLRPTTDLMLIGMDARGAESPRELKRMYHDAGGVWERFIRGGLRASNALLGAEWYRDGDWAVEDRTGEDPPRHWFAIRAVRDVECAALGLSVGAGEVVDFFESWKYGPRIMVDLFVRAGMEQRGVWRSPVGEFYQYLVSFADGSEDGA